MIKKICRCTNTYCVNYMIEFTFHRPRLTRRIRQKCTECQWHLACKEKN